MGDESITRGFQPSNVENQMKQRFEVENKSEKCNGWKGCLTFHHRLCTEYSNLGWDGWNETSLTFISGVEGFMKEHPFKRNFA